MIELLTWCGGGAFLGLIIGVLGYKYSALAYSAFVGALSIIGMMAPTLLSLVGGPTIEGTGGGLMRKVSVCFEAMNLLPSYVQLSILAFVVTFFIARVLAWYLDKYGKEPAVETAEERKRRVLKAYGMKSVDDVRRLQ